MKLHAACYCLLLVTLSCNKPHVYLSNCNNGRSFKKTPLKQIIDHPERYDKQFVEVSGRYISGKNQSALSTEDHIIHHDGSLLWVEFNQQCPLYELNTRAGLFEDYSLYQNLRKRRVIIQGQVNLHNTGYAHRYRAAIERVSRLEW